MAKKFRAGSLYGRTGVFYDAVGICMEAPQSGLAISGNLNASGIINCSKEIVSSGNRVIVGDSSDVNQVFSIRVLPQSGYDYLVSITGINNNTLYFISNP